MKPSARASKKSATAIAPQRKGLAAADNVGELAECDRIYALPNALCRQPEHCIDDVRRIGRECARVHDLQNEVRPAQSQRLQAESLNRAIDFGLIVRTQS